MEKIDLTKLYKNYYSAKATPELVEFETIWYASLTGKGDPSGTEFNENIQALYATLYTLKFSYKAKHNDFIVPKLEALWWFDEALYSGISMEDAPVKIPRKDWHYRLLIRLPQMISEYDLRMAKEKAFEKKKNENIHRIEYYHIPGGKMLQMLHTGPFDKEQETLREMLLFIKKHALKKNGYHHEIYLSDFRKTDPHKLRTILREPVK